MRLAESYAKQGYEVTIRPGSEALPPFARDFKIEILAKRGNGGVLVVVKKDRDELAADPNLTEYARLTANQPGWRFDLAAAEQVKPSTSDINRARDFSVEDIERAFDESQKMVSYGFLAGAIVPAWGAFESSMRMKLRADGRQAGWGSSPWTMLNELYSNGSISTDELPKLEALFRVRNQIAHGFLTDLTGLAEGGVVDFLSGVGRRLIQESQVLSNK